MIYQVHIFSEPRKTLKKLDRTLSGRIVKRLEELAEAKIVLVSVGAGREETIMLEDPFHHLVSS